MRLSDTRLSEIESIPEKAIDTSDIPELDEFGKMLNRLSPKIIFRLNMKSWNGSRNKARLSHTDKYGTPNVYGST